MLTCFIEYGNIYIDTDGIFLVYRVCLCVFVYTQLSPANSRVIWLQIFPTTGDTIGNDTSLSLILSPSLGYRYILYSTSLLESYYILRVSTVNPYATGG